MASDTIDIPLYHHIFNRMSLEFYSKSTRAHQEESGGSDGGLTQGRRDAGAKRCGDLSKEVG